MIQQALRLAAELHYGTDRDGENPLPYLAHVVEVLTILRVKGGVTDPEVLAAACLHDTVEDTGFTLHGIRERFGERVASIVGEVTRHEPPAEDIADLNKSQIWLVRHQLFEEEIQRMSPDAMRIKLADRLSNLAESERTRQGEKKHRYRWQSQRILDLIPRKVAPELWDGIAALLEGKEIRFTPDEALLKAKKTC